MSLVESANPEDLVRGAEAEVNLRSSLSPRSALTFIEDHLKSGHRSFREVAVGLVKVNSRRINDRTYLQVAPFKVGFKPISLEVDLNKPEQVLEVFAAYLMQNGLEGRLSDYYQMNEEQTVAGNAYRINSFGKLENVKFDQFLALPWAEERDIAEDLGVAKRERKQKRR